MSLVKSIKDYEKNLFGTIKYFMPQKNLKQRVRLYIQNMYAIGTYFSLPK